MSNNPNVEDRDRLVKAWRWFRDAGHGTIIMSDIERADAAGLLVTPLMQRAIEACKLYATKWDTAPAGALAEAPYAVYRIGREALAIEEAKKPKERWSAYQHTGDGWWMVGLVGTPQCAFFSGLTEPQARAVAKALNECDR